jgi:hypothetical protein
LFTKDEWKGFEYRNDIFWWYTAGFGFPYAQAQGKGYAQELLSRLTHSEYQFQLVVFVILADGVYSPTYHLRLYYQLVLP